MATRSTFLLGSGAALIGASTEVALSGGTATGRTLSVPNIIIPGRGGTAYFANLPLWTPKEALHHPLTAELNKVPRFTAAARRQLKNLDRAMSAGSIPFYLTLIFVSLVNRIAAIRPLRRLLNRHLPELGI